MFKNLTQFAGLLRGASQLTQRIQELKASLSEKTFEKSSQSSFVVVRMNGLGKVLAIELSPEAFGSERVQLQTEIEETLNGAIQEARRLHLDALKELTGGLELPMVDQVLAEFADI